jgi:hypothetical protein
MSDFLEPPNPRSSDWSRLTIYSLICDALKRAGVYERASKAGWPIGITFSNTGNFLTEVTITAGSFPNTITLGVAIRPKSESFRPTLNALIDQVIGQLNLLI